MTGDETAESQKDDERAVIYLDYQASTPTDARVVAAMLPYFTTRFGNPHSVDHSYGHAAAAAVDGARAKVASIIGAEAREIVFTSGATESNNLAIKGAARFARRTQDKAHVVTCATEHKCVLESCRRLEADGCRVTYLPVGANGLVDLDALAAAITRETALVSIMAVNNEIGVIQPIAEIGALCQERGVTLHTDAAQAVGKVSLDVNAANVDLMSISGHKIYGPMGIGALYVRRRPRARLDALADGGGQERGLRSGTVPLPLAVGLGEALAIAQVEMATESARLAKLRERLLGSLLARLDGVHVNGDLEARIGGDFFDTAKFNVWECAVGYKTQLRITTHVFTKTCLFHS